MIVGTVYMLKPGFGTKDAPWAWGLELKETLIKAKWYPTKADPRVYLRHNLEQLVGILTTHVDDLKGGSDEQVRKELFKMDDCMVCGEVRRSDDQPTTVLARRGHHDHLNGLEPLRFPASPDLPHLAEECEEQGVGFKAPRVNDAIDINKLLR